MRIEQVLKFGVLVLCYYIVLSANCFAQKFKIVATSKTDTLNITKTVESSELGNREPGKFQLPAEEYTQITEYRVSPQLASSKIYNDPHPIMPDAVLVETKVGNASIQVFHHVNSSYRETHPVFTPDGQTLFFVRSHCPDNIAGHDDPQDIYYTQRNNDGSWTKATNMRELNNEASNGVASISSDGKSMLLINSYRSTFSRTSDIAFTVKNSENKWGQPKTLHIKNYHNWSEYADFIWTPDGKAIIMALNRNDSIGGMDLFVSTQLPDGSFGTPQNLGTNINSTKDEFAPFFSPDGKTLYFSSEGHNGYGQADIFRVHRLSDSNWTEWSAAENLGKNINSDKWEAYFTISNTGNICYVRAATHQQRDSDLIQISFKPDYLEMVFKEANTDSAH